MSTHTRARTKRQRRHPDSSDPSHKRDKYEGEKRRKMTYVLVQTPEGPSPRRTFPGLPGHAYTFDGSAWRRCTRDGEFADYLEDQARQRETYREQTKRKGTPVEMLRRVKAPWSTLTTTFAPWLSDWLAAELAASHDPKPQLVAIRNRWFGASLKLLSGQRYVLGYAFHSDTDDPHFDLIVSRQDGKGGRIGRPGLRLVGPWAVSSDRQVRSGAQISEEKRDRLQRDVASFRHRYGQDAKPLDVMLARLLDAAADVIIGRELKPYKDAYAKSVPELERRHAAAQLAALDAARQKLLERDGPAPESPEMSVSP